MKIIASDKQEPVSFFMFYAITPYSLNMDRAAGSVIPSQLGQWIGEANFFWHSKQYTDLQLGQKFPTHRSSTGSTISLRGIRSNDVPQVEHISVVTSSSLPLFSVFLLASSSAWVLERSFRHNGDFVDRNRCNHPGVLCKRLVCSWAKIVGPQLEAWGQVSTGNRKKRPAAACKSHVR